MQTLKVFRTIKNVNATLGQFVLLNSKNRIIYSGVTMERPDKQNQKSISSIPPGTYRIKKRISKKLGKVYEVIDVPNRLAILIHLGNYIEDTTGCILVGDKINYSIGLDREYISLSKPTINNLYSLTDEVLFLTII